MLGNNGVWWWGKLHANPLVEVGEPPRFVLAVNVAD